MKVTITEKAGEPRLEGGWVINIKPRRAALSDARARGAEGKALAWDFILRVEDRSKEDGDAVVALERKEVTLWRPWGRTSPVIQERPLQDGDNMLSVPLAASSLTTLTVNVWQKDAESRRQSQVILLLTRSYKYLAYGLLAPVTLALLVWRWSLLASTIPTPGHPWQVGLGVLSAAGVPLTAVVGSKIVDIIAPRIQKITAAARADRPIPSLLRYPLAWALALVVIAGIGPPVGFARVCNETEGAPSLAGQDAPLMPKSKGLESCELIPILFSAPALDARSLKEFTLSSLKSAPFPSVGFWEPRKWRVMCRENFWAWPAPPKNAAPRYVLRSTAQCSLMDAQELELAPDPPEIGKPEGAKRAHPPEIVKPGNAKSAHPPDIAEKPFSGPATWKFGSGRLQCSAPARATLSFFDLSAHGGAVREVSVACREATGERRLVSHLLLDVASPTNADAEKPFICVPKDSVDCSVDMTAASDAILKVPPKLLQSRRITTDLTTCQFDKDGIDALVGEVRVEGMNALGVKVKDGECTTRWGDEKKKEGYAIVHARAESDDPRKIELSLEAASIGASLKFPRGLFAGRTVTIQVGATPAGEAVCADDADTLLLVGTGDIRSFSALYLGAHVAFRPPKERGAISRAWLCVGERQLDDAAGASCPARSAPDAASKAWRGASTAPGDEPQAKTYFSTEDMDLSFHVKSAVLHRCKPLRALCCFVCPQYFHDLERRESDLRLGACNAQGVKELHETNVGQCSRYPLRSLEKVNSPCN